MVQPETPEVGEAGDGVGDGGQSDWRGGWWPVRLASGMVSVRSGWRGREKTKIYSGVSANVCHRGTI